MLQKALQICYEKHYGQVDKGGKPYFLHPVIVALMGKTNQEKICGLLHDVIEDTDCTLDDLENVGFSQEIIEVVDLLTKKPGESYEEYLMKIKANNLARKVKVNDLNHNSNLSRISSLKNEDFERLEKYRKALKFLHES